MEETVVRSLRGVEYMRHLLHKICTYQLQKTPALPTYFLQPPPQAPTLGNTDSSFFLLLCAFENSTCLTPRLPGLRATYVRFISASSHNLCVDRFFYSPPSQIVSGDDVWSDYGENLLQESLNECQKSVCVPKATSQSNKDFTRRKPCEVGKSVAASKNGAGTRRYFPQVSQRLALHIPVSAGLTTMLTGHGRINAYYHRFRIIQDPTCSCNNGEETVDHILLECTKYNKPRNKLKMIINFKGGRWPPNKTDLMEKYLEEYWKFIREVDLESGRHHYLQHRTVSSQFTARLSWLVLLAQSFMFTESRTPDLRDDPLNFELRSPNCGPLHSNSGLQAPQLRTQLKSRSGLEAGFTATQDCLACSPLTLTTVAYSRAE
ncbi:hypothetical protein ANN_20396 [Periplaneta americana]|uniref:Uncharacterized protein n=1 Tax=Periplaneta americana TaxID=6978 RepID=A0ABQ8SD87_PERAM|nr:hypothetical protein ANN_20396 [Periplaneta americana]